MKPARQIAQLLATWRHYGPGVVARILWSKLRGACDPARALPIAPLARGTPRTLSVLLHTSLHDPGTIEQAIDVLLERDGADWELCLCVQLPTTSTMARLVASVHGLPGFRIVIVAPGCAFDTGTAWTVEQATGRFVALLEPGAEPSAPALERLLRQVGTGGSTDATILVQSKADFLAAGQGVLSPGAMNEGGPRLATIPSTTR